MIAATASSIRSGDRALFDFTSPAASLLHLPPRVEDEMRLGDRRPKSEARSGRPLVPLLTIWPRNEASSRPHPLFSAVPPTEGEGQKRTPFGFLHLARESSPGFFPTTILAGRRIRSRVPSASPRGRLVVAVRWCALYFPTPMAPALRMAGFVRDGGELWAITSYFNPMRYRRRPANYRLFRERLPLPLLAVELGYDGRFELQDGDAEILLQRHGVDVLWQKERLLNIALGALPAECTKVVWIDCDVFFSDAGWAASLERVLDDVALVQPFSRVHYLTREWMSAKAFASIEFSRRSLAAALAGGSPVDESIPSELTDRRSIPAPGFAWAARRDLLERHGFYDAAIIGGGDALFSAAAYGFLDRTGRVHRGAPRPREHFVRWGEPLAADVRGRVGFLDLDLYSLWHGEMENRREGSRFVGLVDRGYDPNADIASEPGGPLRWSSDKPDLHRYVRDYFAARQEDG